MQKILNIETLEDIKAIQEAILNNDDFVIGEIKPLIYKIHLDGGRFENYDVTYIDADVAKIIISQQKNYSKFIRELEKKFNIKFSDESKILKFKLEAGSLEFISDIFDLEVLRNMESKHLMYTMLGLGLLWFGDSIYSRYLEQEEQRIEAQQVLKLKELDGEEIEDYLELTNNTIQTIKEIALNKPLQDSINNPKKEILSVLKEDETLEINNKKLTHEDIPKYEYEEPNVDDIEEVLDDEYKIISYYFAKDKKLFKLDGIRPLANSTILEPLKRMKLIQDAENNRTVKLTIKIIKDGINKKIKSLYILDVH